MINKPSYEIIIGSKYWHYKNKKLYEIVGSAIDADVNSDRVNPQLYVIYRDVSTGQMFIRHPGNFFGWVKDEYGDKTLRFEPA